MQQPKEVMIEETSEYIRRDLRSLKKSFQFRIKEEPAGVAGVGSGLAVVEAFREPILQRDGVKNEPVGPLGGGVAERRESLDDLSRCVGLY